MKILEFIFQNFWYFLGTLALVSIVGSLIVAISKEFFTFLGVIVRGQPIKKNYYTLPKEELQEIIDNAEVIKREMKMGLSKEEKETMIADFQKQMEVDKKK